jgi:hypothetical protein
VAVFFWYLIAAIGIVAALVNFALGAAHRAHPLHALVRWVAGVVSLVPVVGVFAKLALNLHPLAGLETQFTDVPKYVFIVAGLFIGATLMLPAYVERSGAPAEAPTLQERAARPANATVRLEKGADEWVN